MIKAIIGGVGSGKSLSVVKDIVDSGVLTFSNMDIRVENNFRLKKEDIIDKRQISTKKDGTPVMQPYINWDFWNDKTNFNLYLDEIHNIMHSRQSMSKWNVLMSMWVSQIRKILGSSEKNDIVCISQKLARIDVSLRDLLHEITLVRKCQLNKTMSTLVWEKGKIVEKDLPITWIEKKYFDGDFAVENYHDFIFDNKKSWSKRSRFIGNPYFVFYDSFDLIKFGDDVYL